jgi:ankyrin repeat protein
MTKSLNPIKEQQRLQILERQRLQDLGFILTLVGATGYVEEARFAANTCKTLRLDDELWLPILKHQGVRHPLLYALSKKDEKRVHWIADHMHFPCTQVDAEGRNVLWYCIRYAVPPPFIDFFCAKGASVHQTDTKGQTALLYAIVNRSVSWIEALLRQGSDPNHPCKEGITPLYVAARDGNCDIIRALCDAGADATESAALFRAVRYGHLRVVQELLERGAPLDATDEHDNTLLHYAVQFSHPTLCAYLLEWIEVDCLNADDVTPLMLATCPKVWRILFDAGADLHRRGGAHGRMPIHYATRKWKPEIVRLLLANGADKNAESHWGLTAFCYVKSQYCAEENMAAAKELALLLK